MALGRFATQVLADGPIGYWRLGESPGSATAADSSGLGNKGVYSGSGITLGRPGLQGGDTAALFDGKTGRIVVANSASLNPPRITMEANVRWDGPNGLQQRILEKESFAGTTQYGLSIGPSGQVGVELRMRTPGAALIRSALSRGAVSVGAETHIVGTYDGQKIRIYLNGAFDTEVTVANPADIDTKWPHPQNDPEVDLAIGDRMSVLNGHRTFNGLIDEVALFDKALTDRQVESHHLMAQRYVSASAGSVAAWGPNRLDVFGVGPGGTIRHKAWDGSAWKPSPVDWEELGGVFTRLPTVVAWAQNRLDVFGIGADSAMYHKAWDGSAWKPSLLDWEKLGGGFTGPPAAVAWGRNRLDVFGIGADSAMYHKAWDGSAWKPSLLDWERLGGVFTGPPAVVAWGQNRLDIFAVGADSAMYHKAWDGSAWKPSLLDWERLGGVFTGPPAAVAWGQNRLDVFGIGADSAMYHKAWDGSAWKPSLLDWERLGGVFTGPPAAVAWGQNRLDIFGVGTDSRMYHKAWDGSAWKPSLLNWETQGGAFFPRRPSVAAWSENRLDVFGVGTDSKMYHKAWDGSAWKPTPLDWEPLGGFFIVP